MNLNYDLENTATLILAIKCAKAPGQRILAESFYTEPSLELQDMEPAEGSSRLVRLSAAGPSLHIRYQADVMTGWVSVPPSEIQDGAWGNLPSDCLPFLSPSRYCQSDRFRAHAMDLFGHCESQYAIASAICGWIFNHVVYEPGSSNERSSAVDTFEQRVGVCRDFAHLGIAFCRAMSVPARYVSCYSHLLQPNDFHALFEVFINGRWYAFDATRRAPVNGTVRIAVGRDAADASTCTMVGNPKLTNIEVICNARDGGFMSTLPGSHGVAWTMEGR
ncbi:transglutaminase family protein [Luteolibacter sp. SL250]|nr:transglutaminase family protein [Luteolibacter sp. SL250]